ncbi:MAG: hypothetical protein KAT69_06700 [Candidatus Aminicenantes bacterium]|nr:hypothetical protein [Candidatus Aminicenantes bacterium]
MKTEILTEDQAVKSDDFPIELKVYEAGTQLIPTSATITIRDPDGTIIIDAVAVSIAAGGTMTYTLLAAKTVTLWENAIIDIDYVVSTVTYKCIRFFDVVLNALTPCIVDDDLKNHYPELADEIWSGETNYNEQIIEAFKEIKRDLKNKGRRPNMLIDGAQLRIPLIHKSFELIFRDFFKEIDDKWHVLMEIHAQKYRDAFAELAIKYDADEDGSIDPDERKSVTGQINLER